MNNTATKQADLQVTFNRGRVVGVDAYDQEGNFLGGRDIYGDNKDFAKSYAKTLRAQLERKGWTVKAWSIHNG